MTASHAWTCVVPMSGPETFEPYVITADTRRRWSREEKLAIVDEAARTKTSVSAVARRHGIAPSLLFRWRRDFVAAGQACEPQAAPAFIPIALPAPAEALDRHECRSTKPESRFGEGRSGLIELDLAGGRRLRVDGTVDVGVLKRIVDALEGELARAKPEHRFGEDG